MHRRPAPPCGSPPGRRARCSVPAGSGAAACGSSRRTPGPRTLVTVPRKWTSTSSHRAKCSVMRAWITGSACSIPPSVSSLNTTPKPNVSSGALRSNTRISDSGSQGLGERGEVQPTRAAADHGDAHGFPSGCGLGLAQPVPLHLAGGRAGQLGGELDRRAGTCTGRSAAWRSPAARRPSPRRRARRPGGRRPRARSALGPRRAGRPRRTPGRRGAGRAPAPPRGRRCCSPKR